jgi:hypothetical protein
MSLPDVTLGFRGGSPDIHSPYYYWFEYIEMGFFSKGVGK